MPTSTHISLVDSHMISLVNYCSSLGRILNNNVVRGTMGEKQLVEGEIPPRVSITKFRCYLVLALLPIVVFPLIPTSVLHPYLLSYTSTLLSIVFIRLVHSSKEPLSSTICLTRSPTVLPFSVTTLQGTVSVVGTTVRTGT